MMMKTKGMMMMMGMTMMDIFDQLQQKSAMSKFLIFAK